MVRRHVLWWSFSVASCWCLIVIVFTLKETSETVILTVPRVISPESIHHVLSLSVVATCLHIFSFLLCKFRREEVFPATFFQFFYFRLKCCVCLAGSTNFVGLTREWFFRIDKKVDGDAGQGSRRLPVEYLSTFQLRLIASDLCGAAVGERGTALFLFGLSEEMEVREISEWRILSQQSLGLRWRKRDKTRLLQPADWLPVLEGPRGHVLRVWAGAGEREWGVICASIIEWTRVASAAWAFDPWDVRTCASNSHLGRRIPKVYVRVQPLCPYFTFLSPVSRFVTVKSLTACLFIWGICIPTSLCLIWE